MLYGCDLKWWQWHEGVLDFEGRRITQSQQPDNLKHLIDEYKLEVVESIGSEGLSTDNKVIHQGANSGYQALNLAYHFGADKIILLGYDMMVGNKTHFFGDHPDKVTSPYDSFRNNYNSIPHQAKELGLEIINCTRTTALHCFERMSLESALS